MLMNAHLADEILRQLGGSRFVAMTGAKHICNGGDRLHFGLPRIAKNRINRVTIILTADDLYTVRFYNLAGPSKGYAETDIKTVKGVYCDQLREVFERETGLLTSL